MSAARRACEAECEIDEAVARQLCLPGVERDRMREALVAGEHLPRRHPLAVSESQHLPLFWLRTKSS